MDTNTGLALVLGAAFIFAFINGLNDSANAVATLISTRVLAPRRALLLAAAGELIGPFAFGSAVATTIGKDLLKPEAVTPAVLFAALLSAIIWGLLSWYVGLPSSSSHSLVGSLVGGASAAIGAAGFRVEGLLLVILSLLLSPLLGLILGYLTLKALLALLEGATPGANVQFRRLQLLTAFALSVSHGSNDGQKIMGIMAASLVAFGAISSFVVPWWLVGLSAFGLALGTAVGGERLIRTLGARIYRLRPVHGFAAQGSAALVVLGSALAGGPVSASQVMASSIMGVGVAESLSRVRWGVAASILLTWVLVLPATAAMAIVLYRLTRIVFGP